ncbi:MAG: protein TolQ [Pseudomonadota bacterium]|uniref:Protein TolQ n=1 Tax=Candidatus Desulfatibia profunda TaxID=2841695 RepID=A0A8J6NVS3_9BACT|nr:protein TolQ [Candidatus Desulfatibia profunda]MBL7179901.1 protein TolQ [Desulfobacterales bacterium]
MFSVDMNLIHIIRNAGLMVQFVLLLLLFFSITSWAIMIMKYRYIKRAYAESAMFADFFWKSKDLSEAFTKAKQLQGSPIARVFRVGYVELKKLSQSGASTTSPPLQSSEAEHTSLSSRFAGTDTIKRALRRAINTETTRITQMVPFLATTGNTTPFIGLFGTVWGIMNSFHGIGLKGSASLAVVAPGISEALIATAAGLAAAIPAVIAFNHFMQKIRIFESELHNFSADFLNIIERDILNEKGSN